MKNRHERRKEKKVAAHEIIHVSYMVFPTEDGPKFFWFVVPEDIDPNIVNHAPVDASEIIEVESGITMEVGDHTIELHGPFDSEAECQKDSDRVICGDMPVRAAGILDQATLDLIRKRTPRDDVH